jgi:hypothetical protein
MKRKAKAAETTFLTGKPPIGTLNTKPDLKQTENLGNWLYGEICASFHSFTAQVKKCKPFILVLAKALQEHKQAITITVKTLGGGEEKKQVRFITDFASLLGIHRSTLYRWLCLSRQEQALLMDGEPADDENKVDPHPPKSRALRQKDAIKMLVKVCHAGAKWLKAVDAGRDGRKEHAAFKHVMDMKRLNDICKAAEAAPITPIVGAAEAYTFCADCLTNVIVHAEANIKTVRVNKLLHRLAMVRDDCAAKAKAVESTVTVPAGDLPTPPNGHGSEAERQGLTSSTQRTHGPIPASL